MDELDDEADGDGLVVDYRDLACPKCGCNGVRIISHPRVPRPGQKLGWYEQQKGGKGQCDFCNIVFPIKLEVEVEEEPAGG
jgi:hypothetical protein